MGLCQDVYALRQSTAYQWNMKSCPIALPLTQQKNKSTRNRNSFRTSSSGDPPIKSLFKKQQPCVSFPNRNNTQSTVPCYNNRLDNIINPPIDNNNTASIKRSPGSAAPPATWSICSSGPLNPLADIAVAILLHRAIKFVNRRAPELSTRAIVPLVPSWDHSMPRLAIPKARFLPSSNTCV